jgi:hypothetical protein
MIAMMPNTDELLTLQQVREFCKISRTTLWSWENNHGLRTVVVMGTKRIRRSHLEDFLHRHEVVKKAPALAAEGIRP